MAGNLRTTVAAPRKIYEKEYRTPILSFICRKQEKETHEAVDRALQVGIKSG